MGYPSVLTAKTWGFYDVLFKGKRVQVPAALRQLRDGERAVQDLLPGGVPRADRGRMRDDAAPAGQATGIDDIAKITIRTHESAIRIIDKKGPLDNPADRDHCIQYMVAVPLIFGRLTAADYEDERRRRSAHRRAARQDGLRRGPAVHRGLPRSGQALDRQRAHGRIQRRQQDSTEVVVEYPIGHRRRRKEGIPLLVEKFRTNLARRFPAKQQRRDPRRCARPEAARRDAGPRIRRPDSSI